MFGFGKREKREATFTQSEPRSFMEIIGLSGPAAVSMEEALGVPAVWAAVNFISGTIAGLPLNVYDRDSKGNKKKVKATKANPVVDMLHGAVNEDYSSFQWRFDMFTAVLTEGRSITYIERDGAGRPINLFPLVGATVKRLANGRKQYTYTAGGKTQVYDQADVIDVPFMLKSDLLTHRSPLRQCAVAIGKAVHANDYGSKLFKNGGLPAFTLQGPFGSEKSAARAADNIAEATKEAARKGGNVLAIPSGHKLEPLGADPEKMQLVQTQEFAVVEVGRIYSLPPTFLQDLSRATFSNSEQQDLHLVKHTLKRWVEQVEAELNLKLFGRGSSRFAEFNVDGLLRGDYKTRMEGNSTAIQTGQLTPNEARALDNREPLDGGDKLFIQGATVPLDGHTGEAPPNPYGGQ
ncbi:phage portal protein [Sulfitobacter sp. PS-8MA]|uniref:phage portal protein n=1 Tax=Sulfitobacter sp. PS-8MA TaxID=3237707 RepID=UPI0034C6629D